MKKPQALWESLAQEELHALLGRSLAVGHDGVVVIDTAQRIVFFNKGAERIFGYASGETQGQPVGMLLPERFRARHVHHVEAFAAGEDPPRRMSVPRPVRGLRKNGEEFEIDATISSLRGGPDGLQMVLLRDLSDRHDAENAIRAMAERSHETICIFDRNNRFLYINPAYQAVLGYSLDDLTNNYSMADIIHPDYHAQPRLASAGHSHEFRARHKQGHWVWMEGARYPLEFGSQAVTMAIGRDISARKQSEAAAARAAQHQIKIMHSVFDSVETPIVMVNRRWEYTYANQAAAQHMGRDVDSILGHTTWELFPEFVGTNFEEAWRRGMSAAGPTTFEEHYAPRDRWYRVHFFPTTEGMAVRTQDITEFKNTEATQSGLADILTLHQNILSPATLAALNLLPDPLAVMDRELRYAYLNEAAKRVASRPEPDMKGHTPWEIDRSLAPFEKNYRRALETGKRSSFELYYDPADRWFMVELIPSGNQLIAYTVDITRQKKSELAVHKLTNTLEQALDMGWNRKVSRDPSQTAHTHKRKGYGPDR